MIGSALDHGRHVDTSHDRSDPELHVRSRGLVCGTPQAAIMRKSAHTTSGSKPSCTSRSSPCVGRLEAGAFVQPIRQLAARFPSVASAAHIWLGRTTQTQVLRLRHMGEQEPFIWVYVGYGLQPSRPCAQISYPPLLDLGGGSARIRSGVLYVRAPIGWLWIISRAEDGFPAVYAESSRDGPWTAAFHHDGSDAVGDLVPVRRALRQRL